MDRVALAAVILLVVAVSAADANMFSDVKVTFGDDHVWMSEEQTQLRLDSSTGTGFMSYGQILYGSVSCMLKLVPDNSAGTVTTFYLTSPDGGNQSSPHDEIDMEFLGNVSGQPHVLHTNVYVDGNADREQRFYLWFDPTADFHNYTIVWSSVHIVFLVDDIPIRVYRNLNRQGISVEYPTTRPMNLVGSLWCGDQWATQGGMVKTDWSKAPFTANYANLSINGCDPWSSNSACSESSWSDDPIVYSLNPTQLGQLQWVQQNYVVYDYCKDFPRFNYNPPVECSQPQY